MKLIFVRTVVISALCATGALFGATQAVAKFPEKPIGMMVPYPAGGPSDLSARIISGPLSENLGERVVVENLGGATGSIAATKVLNAKPDGSYIFQGTQNELILPVLTNKAIRFKSEDFQNVHQITVTSLVLLVKKDLPVSNVEEFVKLAQAQAGTKPLTYGTVGVGSLYHLVTKRMSSILNVPFVHVPYKGTAPVMQDLSGGQIDFAIQPFQLSMRGMEKEGRYKILAVLSKEIPEPLKDKPSITDYKAFSDFNYQSVAGYFVKRGTPKEIMQTLNIAIGKALQNPEAKKSLEADGRVVAKQQTLEQADAIYQDEIKKYQTIIKETGFKPAE